MRPKLPTLWGILFVAFCIVFIVTTRKRLTIVTLIFIFTILSLAAYLGVNAHNNWVVKPRDLTERLLAAANGQSALAASDFNVESIRANARAIVMSELDADLALTDLPEDFNASSLLISEATKFLADDQQLQRWLLQWLNEHFAGVDSTWQTKSLSKQEHQLRSGESCMMIAVLQHHWQLQSVGPCQVLAATDD